MTIGAASPDQLPEGEGEVVDSNIPELGASGAGTISVGPDDVAAEEEAPKEEGSEPSAEEELIAGKFKTQDDLIKAYKELESKMGAKPEEAEASEDGKEEASDSRQLEIDFEGLGKEFAESGSLSEDSLKALSEAGIPEEISSTYIEGINAIQTLRGNQLYEAAGGKEAYEAAVKWGSQNLDEKQREAFDTAVNAAIIEGDFAAASMMIQSVKAQMGGNEPSYVKASTGSTNAEGIRPFESREDMMAAMRDPRYSKDAEYVAMVQKRLAIS